MVKSKKIYIQVFVKLLFADISIFLSIRSLNFRLFLDLCPSPSKKFCVTILVLQVGCTLQELFILRGGRGGRNSTVVLSMIVGLRKIFKITNCRMQVLLKYIATSKKAILIRIKPPRINLFKIITKLSSSTP